MKLVCDDHRCGWVGTEPLRAPDPFEQDCELIACPKCRGITLVNCCDEPGCSRIVQCGTPTPNGYRKTCGQHAPR